MTDTLALDGGSPGGRTPGGVFGSDLKKTFRIPY